MSNQTLEKRDGFQSKWGFILACIGSAVGMGNIWRFPIMVSTWGGLTFLIPYFIFVVLIGASGVIEEFALGRRAADIFRQLTDGQYGGVALDRSFHLSAEPSGSPVYRDAALLSAGTLDQLYLAVRLAICELVLPPSAPLVLDDALANFDDTRCAAALRLLREYSRDRQILLFTCHSREAIFFSGDTEVCIQQLTDSARLV